MKKILAGAILITAVIGLFNHMFFIIPAVLIVLIILVAIVKKSQRLKAHRLQMEKVEQLMAYGPEKIDIRDRITQNRDCYYCDDVYLLSVRTRNGERYYDYDNAVQRKMYLFSNTMEFLGTGEGHVEVKLNGIVDIRYDDDLVLIVMRNAGAPRVIQTHEPIFLAELITVIINSQTR